MKRLETFLFILDLQNYYNYFISYQAQSINFLSYGIGFLDSKILFQNISKNYSVDFIIKVY